MEKWGYYFCLVFLFGGGLVCIFFPSKLKKFLLENRPILLIAIGFWMIICGLLIMKQNNWISGLGRILQAFGSGT